MKPSDSRSSFNFLSFDKLDLVSKTVDQVFSEKIKCTKEEHEAFQGLEDSYLEMDRKLQESAPKCHFTPMIYESSECEYGATNSWWECTHCGHTKEL